MADSAKITTACDLEITFNRDFLKWVSIKSVCNPEQRRRVWGSGDKALLPGGRRFFDFAQNDSRFARNHYGLAKAARGDENGTAPGGSRWRREPVLEAA